MLHGENLLANSQQWRKYGNFKHDKMVGYCLNEYPFYYRQRERKIIFYEDLFFSDRIYVSFADGSYSLVNDVYRKCRDNLDVKSIRDTYCGHGVWVTGTACLTAENYVDFSIEKKYINDFLDIVNSCCIYQINDEMISDIEKEFPECKDMHFYKLKQNDDKESNNENSFLSSLSMWISNRKKGYQYNKEINFQENIIAWTKARGWGKNCSDSFCKLISEDVEINRFLYGEFRDNKYEEITESAQRAIELILNKEKWVNSKSTAEDFYVEVFEDFLADKKLINKKDEKNINTSSLSMVAINK
jgi:hypothetical protein